LPYLSGEIRLVTIVPVDDPTLLPALVAHYRRLGVTTFHAVAHLADEDAESVERLHDRAAAAGIAVERTVTGPWDEDLNQRLYQETMQTHPHDWYVIADADEFHVWDRALEDVVRLCEEHGYDSAGGCMLDRVSRDGTMLEAPDDVDALFETFPLAGQFAAVELGALATKVTLARGRVPLHIGQHRAAGGVPCPASVVCAQVHHFKWHARVLERLELRARRYREGAWRLRFPETLQEAEGFVHLMNRADQAIDVRDPRYLLVEAGPGFHDYPFWDAVRSLALAHVEFLARGYAEANARLAAGAR
jgi:hypothetical protein